jgi:hypothetical protein
MGGLPPRAAAGGVVCCGATNIHPRRSPNGRVVAVTLGGVSSRPSFTAHPDHLMDSRHAAADQALLRIVHSVDRHEDVRAPAAESNAVALLCEHIGQFETLTQQQSVAALGSAEGVAVGSGASAAGSHLKRLPAPGLKPTGTDML